MSMPLSHFVSAYPSPSLYPQVHSLVSLCLFCVCVWNTEHFLFFFFLISFYLFMAVLGPRFCVRAFSSCGERGPLFIAVHGPLTIAASPVVEHRLQTRRLSNCGSWAQLLRGMWDPPRPGLEPVSPALAGRFSTTVPPGKPPRFLLTLLIVQVCWWLIFSTFVCLKKSLFQPCFWKVYSLDVEFKIDYFFLSMF